MSTHFDGWPLKRSEKLYHLGSLREDFRKRGFSLEGDCLSASLCPDDWERIARLGGCDLLTLTRRGGLYLDAHGVQKPQMKYLHDRLVSSGYAEKTSWFRAWRYDGENDEWFTLTFWDENEAIENAEEGVDGCPSDSGETVERLTGYRLTEKGRALVGHRLPDEPSFADDAALIILAHELRETSPDVCGVFWNDKRDPERLSAPRYGILPQALPEFTVSGPLGEMGFEDYKNAALQENLCDDLEGP